MNAGLQHRFSRSAAKPESEPKPKAKRPAPLSIRVSKEERKALQRAAAGRSVNSYIRERIFGDQPKALERGKTQVKDYEALAKVLSLLGRSDIATRLSALIMALEMNRLELSGEAEAELRSACADVKAMRAALITALGLKAR